MSPHPDAARAPARRGLMLVLSSPSGAGKTTLSRRLLEADPDITMSVSVTTRTPRPGEVDGVRLPLHRPRPASRRMAADGELLEWAPVFDHHYGTPRAPVEAALAGGPRRAVRHRLAGHPATCARARRDDLVTRVHPAALGRRAGAAAAHPRPGHRRGDRESAWRKAADEISHWAEYDYVIVNDDVRGGIRVAAAILAAERLKRERQTGLTDFVRGLIRDLEPAG